MADPILITCDACKKQLKVPATAAGKKVRCKNCKAVIPVPEPKVHKAGGLDWEAEDGKNPYGVTETSLANRCPFCAHDIDPPDARICLNCGYDLEQRGRRESQVVQQRTAADFIKWHLPTLGAFLGIVGVFLAGWFYHFKLPEKILSARWAEEIAKDRWGYFENDQAEGMGFIFHWGIEVWGIVFGLFALWKFSLFIFRRLAFDFLPPEKTFHTKAE